jgi:hypothetical protein
VRESLQQKSSKRRYILSFIAGLLAVALSYHSKDLVITSEVIEGIIMGDQ